MGAYADFHRRSIEDREAFWTEEAQRIHWHRPFDQVLDYSKPPFAKWFVGGQNIWGRGDIAGHRPLMGGGLLVVTHAGQGRELCGACGALHVFMATSWCR